MKTINILILDDIYPALKDLQIEPCVFTHLRDLALFTDETISLTKLLPFLRLYGTARDAKRNQTKGEPSKFDMLLVNAHLGESARSNLYGIDLLWKGIRLHENESFARIPVIVYSPESGSDILGAYSRKEFHADIFEIPPCQFIPLHPLERLATTFKKGIDELMTRPLREWESMTKNTIGRVGERVSLLDRNKSLQRYVLDLLHYLEKRIPFRDEPIKKKNTSFYKTWLVGRVRALFTPELSSVFGFELSKTFVSQREAIETNLSRIASTDLSRDVNEFLNDVMREIIEVCTVVAGTGSLLECTVMNLPYRQVIAGVRRGLEETSQLFRPLWNLCPQDYDETANLTTWEQISVKCPLYWEKRLSLEVALWQIVQRLADRSTQEKVIRIFADFLDPIMEALETLKMDTVKAIFTDTDRLVRLGGKRGLTFKDVLDEMFSRACANYSSG